MSEKLMIISFILIIIGIIATTDILSRIKLKEKINNDWGNIPRNTNKDSEESLYKAYSNSFSEKETSIDDLTWNDLDMYDVFRRLNLTYSSIGSEALYQTLRTYSFKSDELDGLEQLIDYFEQNPLERATISYRFARLGKKDFNYAKSYLNQNESNPLNHQSIFIILSLLPFISLASISFIGITGAIFFIAAICFNTIFYLIKKTKLETELGAMSYLVQGISLGVSLSKKEAPFKEDLKQNSHPFHSILKFAFAFRVKTGGEMEMFIEMLSAAFLLPFISYNAVFKKCQKNNQEALNLWLALGKIEVAIAVLNLRTIYDDYWCLPNFQGEGITAENVIHPLLTEPVPNPIDWKQSTLITGSNASGKSTYVRAVAINCIFAQTINTCLATSFNLQRGHILSSMGVQDSIQEGDSYFIAELKSLQRLIDQVKKEEFCYCFIDEILKGTNTIERISASTSVIQWLVQHNQLAFIATHDIELPQILQRQCASIHFDETVSKEEGVTFDYLLKNGPATSRNAIKLIESMDFPTSIVKGAFEKAYDFEKNGTWFD